MKTQIIYKIFLNKKIAIVTISLFEAVAGLQNLINIYGENNVTIYKQIKNKKSVQGATNKLLAYFSIKSNKVANSNKQTTNKRTTNEQAAKF